MDLCFQCYLMCTGCWTERRCPSVNSRCRPGHPSSHTKKNDSTNKKKVDGQMREFWRHNTREKFINQSALPSRSSTPRHIVATQNVSCCHLHTQPNDRWFPIRLCQPSHQSKSNFHRTYTHKSSCTLHAPVFDQSDSCVTQQQYNNEFFQHD